MHLNDKHLYSLPKAAALLGVSRWTLWRMVVDGQIPATDIVRSGRKRPCIYFKASFFAAKVALPPIDPTPVPAGAVQVAGLSLQVEDLVKKVDRLTRSTEAREKRIGA